MDKLEIIDDSDNVYSKFNLRDASELTSDTQNGTGGKEEEADELDTPRTIKADDGQESIEKVDDRRCSVDVTPTLTVTGTVCVSPSLKIMIKVVMKFKSHYC